ncbi:MAG TPA: hypothetical protein VF574_12795 [Allosphingosinicella sp.]|jgi:hypothetical protein
MSGKGLNLSGRWNGFYNYPGGPQPCPFTAELRDDGGLIAGETSEPGDNVGCPEATLQATLEGRREGASVAFTKVYDLLEIADYPIHYEGTATAEGDEIQGRWNIPGEWSGPFLMVRESSGAEAAGMAEEATVRA